MGIVSEATEAGRGSVASTEGVAVLPGPAGTLTGADLASGLLQLGDCSGQHCLNVGRDVWLGVDEYSRVQDVWLGVDGYSRGQDVSLGVDGYSRGRDVIAGSFFCWVVPQVGEQGRADLRTCVSSLLNMPLSYSL